MPDKYEQQIIDLETDILLLLYTFSDQFGEVDLDACKKWAREILGVYIPWAHIKLNQKHVDVLVQRGVIPDIKLLMDRIKNPPRED